MKKILISTAALALSFGLLQTSNALARDHEDLSLDHLVEGITMSVRGLDLLAFNAAVNTASIDGSVTIEAGGKLQSAFPAPSGTDVGMQDLSEVLATFINKIDATAIGAYSNGSIEIAAATEAIAATSSGASSFEVGIDAGLDVAGSESIAQSAGSVMTWCGIKQTGSSSLDSELSLDASLDASLAKEVSYDKSFELNSSGLIGDTVAFNAALNTADINGSVSIGGFVEGTHHTPAALAAIDFTNVQISTQAIGAYTAGVVNVGFSGLSVK